MTQRDFDRIARAWLEDGPVQMPDRGLLAALGEIHLTPQRRAPWPRRRFIAMNGWARVAAAAVVVTGFAVAVFSLLPREDDVGPGSSPSPRATLTDAPAAPPSTLSIIDTFASYRVTFPARPGWSERDAFVIEKETATLPGGLAIGVVAVANLYEDGCRWQSSLMDRADGPTVEDLANAMAELADREVTSPVEVNVGGHAGYQLEMTIPDVDVATCDQAEVRSWIDADGSARFHHGPGEHARVLILDVDGTRLVVFGRSVPDNHPGDVADLNLMLDSIQVEPLLPGPSSSTP